MALTLTQRLTAAKKPHARLADNEKLLSDLKAEQEKLSEARDRAAAESVDFALSEGDRDEAAAKAGRYERTLKGLETEIAGLGIIIAEKRDSEAAQRAEAERAAIRDERDKLAAEFAEKVPSLVDQLTDLFARVNANAERLIAIGDRNGCAEAKARGLSSFIDPFGPKQFTKMQIPDFHGRERIWPPIEPVPAVAFDYAKQMEDARRKREQEAERKRKAAEKHAWTHGFYLIQSKLMGEHTHRLPEEIVDAVPGLPATITTWSMPWRGDFPHALVEKLQAAEPGLTVSRLDQARQK